MHEEPYTESTLKDIPWDLRETILREMAGGTFSFLIKDIFCRWLAWKNSRIPELGEHNRGRWKNLNVRVHVVFGKGALSLFYTSEDVSNV